MKGDKEGEERDCMDGTFDVDGLLRRRGRCCVTTMTMTMCIRKKSSIGEETASDADILGNMQLCVKGSRWSPVRGEGTSCAVDLCSECVLDVEGGRNEAGSRQAADVEDEAREQITQSSPTIERGSGEWRRGV